jgi:hypothetical protein
MDSTIHISFRYSELDYVRALRAHYASRLRLKLDVAVAVATALLGVYLWQSLDSRSWGIGLVCLSAVLVLMLVAAFGVIPKLVFVVSLNSAMNIHLRFHQRAFISAQFTSIPSSNGPCIVADWSALTHSFSTTEPIHFR